MSRVSVPPISRVMGVSRAMAIATRARYEEVERTYQPFGARAYEETSAESCTEARQERGNPEPDDADREFRRHRTRQAASRGGRHAAGPPTLR